ncbi:MAG: histidine phosphatase family protein [Planctomycetia bacterium]|nr:histidine phosphatase family protein [Planctomycetia bacterium]
MTAIPKLYLVRHGETEWSLSGRHTGLTDKPLIDCGRENARRLPARLAEVEFTTVLCSPLARARQTCELTGFGARAVIDADLVEWDYGDYEGRTTADIRSDRPDWRLFVDGCPGGESPTAITQRVERVLGRVRPLDGNTLLFSSGDCLRALAVRWLGLDVVAGQHLLLGTASVSILTYRYERRDEAIELWNDRRHVEESKK